VVVVTSLLPQAGAFTSAGRDKPRNLAKSVTVK
jgi:hypothetical protein